MGIRAVANDAYDLVIWTSGKDVSTLQKRPQNDLTRIEVYATDAQRSIRRKVSFHYRKLTECFEARCSTSDMREEVELGFDSDLLSELSWTEKFNFTTMFLNCAQKPKPKCP